MIRDLCVLVEGLLLAWGQIVPCARRVCHGEQARIKRCYRSTVVVLLRGRSLVGGSWFAKLNRFNHV